MRECLWCLWKNPCGLAVIGRKPRAGRPSATVSRLRKQASEEPTLSGSGSVEAAIADADVRTACESLDEDEFDAWVKSETGS